MKKAFLFPGQGSQKVGMVHDLYTRYDAVKKLIGEADERLGFSISKLMFEGPDDELMKTEFTQPAILTASVAVWTVLKEHGVTPDVVAGHSLGEYSALVAAGVMSFSDAVHTVHLRGKYMQEAVPLGEGGMAAIIALKPEIIEEICEKISSEGKPVQAVNYNCPGQVVIAGATEAVKQACVEMKEAGAKMAIMLKVSAPFHSTLMEPAAKKLESVLSDITIHDAQIPVYANYTAKPE
ncbi:MAG: [acyl-carrier-protein] S-malonyltransferase, partial [Veillonellaceae bacterium]